MNVNRRSQVDRSAATRAALVDAARPLFAEHGFGGVGTETIVRAAGRHARRAVPPVRRQDRAVRRRVRGGRGGHRRAHRRVVLRRPGADDPVEALRTGAGAWLDACAEPEVQRIVLLDAPAVLGWERWREIGMRYGMGLVEGVLGQAMEVGRVRPPATATRWPTSWSARWTRQPSTWRAPTTPRRRAARRARWSTG